MTTLEEILDTYEKEQKGPVGYTKTHSLAGQITDPNLAIQVGKKIGFCHINCKIFDKHYAKQIITTVNGYLYAYLAKHIQDDIEIKLLALEHGENLHFVNLPNSFKSDKNLALKMVDRHFVWIEWFSKKLQDDNDVIKAALKCALREAND